MAEEETPTAKQKLDPDNPILEIVASTSTDHEDDLLRRRDSKRWAGGDNLSAAKMGLMLSHMKNRLTDLTQNDEEVQRLAIEANAEINSPLTLNQSRKSEAHPHNNTPMTIGSNGKSIPDSRSKSPAAVSLARRHAGDDDGSVISSYSRRSTVSKPGNSSAQKPAQRGGSNTNTPSKASTGVAAGRASTPNKLSTTSGASMKTPSKPQSSAGGMTTPNLGQRKSIGDNYNSSAPGSRSSSANRSRGSSTTTATTSTTGNAEKRLYNHDNTRRLSGASAISSSSAVTIGPRTGAVARPTAAAASSATAINGVRAVSRVAASTTASNRSSIAGASSMKSPPARASSAQRSSISAPNSAIKANINNSSRASLASTSSAANPTEKRATSTSGRSRGTEPIVLPSANLLRSSATGADIRGPTTPNKAAAVRRPILGSSGTAAAYMPQQQRVSTAAIAELVDEPKTEDLQKNMQTLARKFATLKVKAPTEHEGTDLDTPIAPATSSLTIETEVSYDTATLTVPEAVVASNPPERSPTAARLSRSNSGSSANGSITATHSVSSFVPSSLERKRSISPVMVRAGSTTNVISPSSQSSSTLPFHRTGSINQMNIPNKDRVLRSHDELDYVVNESNGNGNMFGLNHSNSNSCQNLIPVPLKIRLEFPARQILPPEPVLYMESLQHSTPVAIQAIYRAASVSANSSPAHKTSHNNGSASGTPKSGGKKKSGW